MSADRLLIVLMAVFAVLGALVLKIFILDQLCRRFFHRIF